MFTYWSLTLNLTGTLMVWSAREVRPSQISASCLEVAGIWHRATTSLRIKRHFKHQLLKSDRRKQEKSQTLMQWAAAQLPHFTIVSRFFPNTWNIKGKQRQDKNNKPAGPRSLQQKHLQLHWCLQSLPWIWHIAISNSGREAHYLGYGSDGEGVQLAMLNSDDWVAPLGDHHKSAAAAVLLSKMLCMLFNWF